MFATCRDLSNWWNFPKAQTVPQRTTNVRLQSNARTPSVLVINEYGVLGAQCTQNTLMNLDCKIKNFSKTKTVRQELFKGQSYFNTPIKIHFFC